MNFLGDTYLPLYNNFFRYGFIEYQVIFDKENYIEAINELFKLKQLISSKGNAIDIGCNKGLFSYALSKQSKIIKK